MFLKIKNFAGLECEYIVPYRDRKNLYQIIVLPS